MTTAAQTPVTVTVITPRRRFLALEIGELWRYRYLVQLLTRRNLVSLYKQSVLGPLWHVLTPLLSAAVFAVVFGYIARIGSDGVPHLPFYLAGVVFWTLFSTLFQQVATTFIDNIALFGKVYFPRLAAPLAIAASKLFTFGVQSLVLLSVLAYYYATTPDLRPSALFLALLPLNLLLTVALALGCGLLVAAATVKYRDLGYMLTFVVQLWMYATPIVYPASLAPERWRWLLALNPVTALAEGFRCAFFAGEAPPLWWLGCSAGMCVILLLAGLLAFSRVERTFVDTI